MCKSTMSRRVRLTTSHVALVLLVSAASAVAGFSKTIILQETAEQHIEKAREAYKNKKYGAAKDEVKRALSLDKSLPPAHLLLGMIDLRQGKLSDAERSVKEALKYKPDYADAHLIMAYILLQRGNFHEARNKTEVAISEGLQTANVFS